MRLNQNQGAVYLMIDPCQIPYALAQFIQVFNLHDGNHHIIGYCIPIKYCVELFSNISLARVVRTWDSPPLNEQFLTKFKFKYPPLNVMPMNEKDFREMMKSPSIPNRCPPGKPSLTYIMRNRFFVRPITPQVNNYMERRQSSAQKSEPPDSALNFIKDKYKLHLNPHLISFRLPDGLDCFIRLDLAQHCQHDFSEREHNAGMSYRCVRAEYYYRGPDGGGGGVEDDFYSMARKIGLGGRQKLSSASK